MSQSFNIQYGKASTRVKKNLTDDGTLIISQK